MNQMDENYWKQLAQDWIRKQSQTSEDLLPKDLQIPEAPKISFTDNTNYDNLAVADMDIEDVKEEPTQELWNSIQQLPTFSNIQQTPFIQVSAIQQFPASSNRFQKNQDAPRKSHFTPQQPLIIPDPPTINNIEDQINTIDMDMDDSDNDDSNSNSASSVSMMDIQKRKKLPIWIREGLEKMKREKELEEARIREEHKRKEDEENRKKLMEEALKEIEKEKVSKSKYESSDSETEETDNNVPQNQHEPIENDEEAYETMMLLVRKTLTQLLLEVTDEKIQEISTETLSKYRKKATATTKPALIGLGLGAYSSSTDDDDSDNENGENSDWEDESVLRERIHKKQIIFEKLVNERIDKQAAEEEERLIKKRSSSKSDAEQVKHAKIRQSDSDDDRQKFKSSRKDGEEKYETMIYSISTSSGPIMRMQREKKTRFSDPKDGRSTTQMTHLGMVDSTRLTSGENGTNSTTPKIVVPQPPPIIEKAESRESPKKEKKKRRDSTSSSSDSGHRKKHKKHKKSSKHSKKSSKKKDKSRSRSRSRDREKRHHSSKSDRRSIESKTSIRSSESSRRRSRSRSRSRDRHRRRY